MGPKTRWVKNPATGSMSRSSRTVMLGGCSAYQGPVGVILLTLFADVVDVGAFGAAPHPAVAQVADQVGAQEVGPRGPRVGVGGGAGAGALPEPAYGAGRFEQFPGDQWLVGGLPGPDPGARWVDTAPDAAIHSRVFAPVPYHVAGVFGVVEDLADGAIGPGTDAAPTAAGDRVGWRVPVEVGVEPVGDRLVGQPFQGPPGEDLGDDLATDRVGDEFVLVPALQGLGLDRVADLPGLVAVRRFADVEPLVGVDFKTAPDQFEHVVDVPLGDGLLDPAGQCRGGPFGWSDVFGEGGDRSAVKRLVGGEQGDAGLLQFVFEPEAAIHRAVDALDGFADHCDEPAVGLLGLDEQIGDAAVTGDGDIEVLVPVAPAAELLGGAAGFDVVEVGDDDELVGQRMAGAVQLAR